MDHEKISLGECRLLSPCWYQLYKCQLKVRHGTIQLYLRICLHKEDFFYVLWLKRTMLYTLLTEKRKTFFFCFPGGYLQKWPLEGFHPHFFLPHLVIIQSYSSAICILNQHEIFLRISDGNCRNNTWKQSENFFKHFQIYNLVLFLSLSREAWWCSSMPESS